MLDLLEVGLQMESERLMKNFFYQSVVYSTQCITKAAHICIAMYLALAWGFHTKL